MVAAHQFEITISEARQLRTSSTDQHVGLTILGPPMPAQVDLYVRIAGPARIVGLQDTLRSPINLSETGLDASIRLRSVAEPLTFVHLQLELPFGELYPPPLLVQAWLVDPAAPAGTQLLATASATIFPTVGPLEVGGGSYPSPPPLPYSVTPVEGSSPDRPQGGQAQQPPQQPAWPTPATQRPASGSGSQGVGGAGVDELPVKPIRDPVVNTGFALAHTPWQPLSTDHALAAGGSYLFWLDIQRLVENSIESVAVPLPPGLPTGTVLTVAVFGVPGGIGIDPDRAIGRLTLRSNGTAFVSYQPFLVDSGVAAERLFFPVTAPERSGMAKLWCYLYWRQVLLQTRLIEAEVATSSILAPHALTSTVEYRIADPIDALAAPRQPEHAASFHLDGDGSSHVLRVMATDGSQLLRAQASIGDGQLGDQIQMSRGALRRVAWGSEQPWQPGIAYRYETQPPLEQITEDLILLAVNGYRLHHLLLKALGRGSGVDSYGMTDLVGNALRRPGFVQVALQKSAGHVVPAAMIYDLPLDSNASKLRLCTDFVASAQKNELFGSACLTGVCSQATDPDPEVVCPGGFWGFRHALGMPLSVASAPAVPMALPYGDGLGLTGGVYQDFATTGDHVEALRELLPWHEYRLGRDRTATLEALHGAQSQVIYFYCHGGVSGNIPYLRVGRDGDPVITPDNLYQRRVRWPRSRPLVFLNGCRTSELSPDQAIDFVGFFVEEAWASGAIGTEITVFEPLADAFARECLRAFLVDGEAIGAAVTRARISLLAGGNPLGLAYIPYVLPSLRVER